MILLAILLPPLYYLAQKKFGMFLLTSAMFVVSFFMMLTMVLIPGSLILWAIAAIAAICDYKRKVVAKTLDAHARKIGTEVAASLLAQSGVRLGSSSPAGTTLPTL